MFVAGLRSRRADIRGDYDYRYDPDHANKPQGSGWEKTNEGWSKQIGKPTKQTPEEEAEKKKKAPEEEGKGKGKGEEAPAKKHYNIEEIDQAYTKAGFDSHPLIKKHQDVMAGMLERTKDFEPDERNEIFDALHDLSYQESAYAPRKTPQEIIEKVREGGIDESDLKDLVGQAADYKRRLLGFYNQYELPENLIPKAQAAARAYQWTMQAAEELKKPKPEPSIEKPKYKESPIADDPPWKEHFDKIVEHLSSTAPKSYVEDEKLKKSEGKGHLNRVFFEKYNGEKGVFKPVKDERYIRDARRNMRASVSQATREVTAFKLDQVLGLGVIPPTVWSKKDYGEQGEKLGEGSCQSFVPGVPAFKFNEQHNTKVWLANSKKAQRSMRKLALFDIVAGSSDRHGLNYFVDTDKDAVYGIDNGLSFPEKEDTREFRSEPVGWMTNLPCHFVNLSQHHIDGVVRDTDNDILRHLSTIKKDDFVGTFKGTRLNKEADLSWDRLQKIVKSAKKYGKLTSPEEEPTKKEVPAEEPPKVVGDTPAPAPLDVPPLNKENLEKLQKALGGIHKTMTPEELAKVYKDLAKDGFFGENTPKRDKKDLLQKSVTNLKNRRWTLTGVPSSSPKQVPYNPEEMKVIYEQNKSTVKRPPPNQPKTQLTGIPTVKRRQPHYTPKTQRPAQVACRIAESFDRFPFF